MTTYAEFKEYYTRKLWRVGDTDFATDLDRLILNAEARNSRDVEPTRIVQGGGGALTFGQLQLPDAYGKMMSVETTIGERRIVGRALEYTLFLQQKRLYNANNAFSTRAVRVGDYSITNNILDVLGGGSSSCAILYYPRILPFSTDPSEVFYDLYPDLYEAALDVQAYGYLKDYAAARERKSDYEGMLESYRRDETYVRYPGGNLNALPPGQVM